MKKFISWNVNGFRAVMKKNFEDVFYEADADIFCLQETKLQAGQTDFAPKGYHCYWNYAEKKGYSGTAVFAKEEPLSVSYGVGIPCMIPRDASSHWSIRIITLLPFIRPTRRTG